MTTHDQQHNIDSGSDLRNARDTIKLLQAENEALMMSSRAVLEHTSFADAAKHIFNECKQLIGATAGYVALLDPDETENQVLFLDSGGQICSVDPELPMPIRGLRAQSYRDGKTVYENSFTRSDWIGLLPPGHMNLDNVMFAPLVIEGSTVGVIGLANKPGGFTPQDARQASQFGQIASIALKNSRALERLEQGEQRYRSLFENLNDAAFLAESETGIITDANIRAEELLGRTRGEIIGIHQSELHPKEASNEYIRRFQEHNLKGSLANYQGEVVRKDGAVIPVEISASNVIIYNRKYTLGLFRDISVLKTALEDLSFHADILANVRDSVIVTDTGGRIIYWNHGAQQLYGYTAEEVMGKAPAMLYPFPDHRMTDNANPSLLAGGDIRVDVIARRKDGREIWVDIKKSILTDATGRLSGFIGISQDITERKLAEEEINKRMMFERTISFIASGFVAGVSIDVAINDSLDAIGRLTGADRCYLKRFRDNLSIVDNTHEWYSEHTTSEMNNFQGIRVNPDSWGLQLLKQGQTLRIDDIQRLSAGSTREKETLQTSPAKSGLVIPLHVNNQLYGYIGIEDIAISKKRDHEDIAILQIAAGIISTALERNKATAELSQNQRLLNTTGWVAGVGGWELETASRNLKWTDEVYNITETEPGTLASIEDWIALFGPASRNRFENAVRLSEESCKSFDLELEFETGSDVVKWLHIIGRVEQKQGLCIKVYGAVQDITERKRVEERIRSSLEEKELLLKEIHHRVKNNMQVISSLLRLQASAVKDEESRSLLQEGQDRIKAMSLVYNRLYQSGNLADLDFGQYLKDMAVDLVRSHAVKPSLIKTTIEAEHIRLNVDQAIPCGLVVNELLVNSIKYAFDPEQKGNIWITVKTNPEAEIILQVGDDGKGIPVDMDIDTCRSMGLRLVKSLVEHQLGGKLVLNRNHGTEFLISFKINTGGTEQ